MLLLWTQNEQKLLPPQQNYAGYKYRLNAHFATDFNHTNFYPALQATPHNSAMCTLVARPGAVRVRIASGLPSHPERSRRAIARQRLEHEFGDSLKPDVKQPFKRGGQLGLVVGKRCGPSC